MRLPGIVKRVKLAYEDRRDIFRYLYHMLSKKVYLGSYMHASYLEPERKSGMIKAFEAMIRTRQSPIAVLEVGTYGGASSILWADLLKRWGKSGFVVCNDVWRPFNTQRNRTSYIDYLLKNDRIFRLFHHNVKSAGHEDTIRTVRMNSLEFLPMIKDRSFDFIMKTPPVPVLIKKALELDKGSPTPNTSKVGTLSNAQVEGIAQTKMPDLNCYDLEAAKQTVAGTARSMGVEVAD